MSHPAGPVVPGWTPRPAPTPEGLVGPRVRIVPLDVAQAPALHAAFGPDPALWDFMGHGPFADAAAYADWVRSVQGGTDPVFVAILDAADGAPLGVASWLRIDRAMGVAEVGNIVFSPALQGTAAATEAIHLMTRRVFDLGYRRFEWKCNANNAPSRRAAERFGFSYEGTFRQHMIVKGMSRDTAWFAMTDGDWAAVGPVQARWLDAANFDAAGRQRLRLSDLTRPLLVTRDPGRG